MSNPPKCEEYAGTQQKVQADHLAHIFLSRKNRAGNGISWNLTEPEGINDVTVRRWHGKRDSLGAISTKCR
jgi:hypothetical protein